MTINVAWKQEGVAYLVADSVYSSQRAPVEKVTSMGESAIRGNRSCEEGAPKLVALGSIGLAALRGDVQSAHTFINHLRPHIGEARPLDEILAEVWNLLGLTHDFGLSIARALDGLVELWTFDSRHPSRAKLMEDVMQVDPTKATLAVSIEGSGCGANVEAIPYLCIAHGSKGNVDGYGPTWAVNRPRMSGHPSRRLSSVWEFTNGKEEEAVHG